MNDFLIVEKIILKDGTILENKQVFTSSGHFVIVADRSEDPTFTWFNVSEIRYMEGVTKSHSDGGKIGVRMHAW